MTNQPPPPPADSQSPAGSQALAALRAALLSHPRVEDAAAVCLPGLTARPVAAVVAGNFVSGPELRRHVEVTLGSGQVPDLVALLPALPRTPQGDLDLAALRSQVETVPSVYRYTPPGTETERWLAGMWGTLLGRPGIGTGDDFLELGGDSLSATIVLTEIHATYGVTVCLTDLFELGTVGRLAAAVDARRDQGS
jgi:acyl carrier protein